jgi:hypothetical protein
MVRVSRCDLGEAEGRQAGSDKVLQVCQPCQLAGRPRPLPDERVQVAGGGHGDNRHQAQGEAVLQVIRLKVRGRAGEQCEDSVIEVCEGETVL